MAEKTRLEMLEEWHKQKPKEAFTRYALAMELKSQGRQEDALRHFDGLMKENGDYVPAYLMHGQLLVSLGRADDARKVLEKGIGTASRLGNSHAAGEMQELLSSLE